MNHGCKNKVQGNAVCAEHMLTRDGLRYRFRKQMEAVFPLEELIAMHELMMATMLETEKGVIPLDDRPAKYINQFTRGKDEVA
jgi:hypothetical protein